MLKRIREFKSEAPTGKSFKWRWKWRLFWCGRCGRRLPPSKEGVLFLSSKKKCFVWVCSKCYGARPPAHAARYRKA